MMGIIKQVPEEVVNRINSLVGGVVVTAHLLRRVHLAKRWSLPEEPVVGVVAAPAIAVR